MGEMIRMYRKEQKLTTQDLADRAGISRTTLQKIEKGDMKCEIGIVFEVATLVGVKLFGGDPATLEILAHGIKSKIALLPKNTHKIKRVLDDDF
jgi:DNA-binding XRE family transcriptional regulator